MDLDLPNPTLTGSLSAAQAQKSAALADLLAASPDLAKCCETGLKFLLEFVKRPGGLLFVCSAEDDQPLLIVQQCLSAAWVSQIGQTDSPIRRLAQDFLVRGVSGPDESRSENGPEIESLAAAIPLISQAGPQGALLVKGKPLGSDQTRRLAELGAVLSRSIQVLRSTGDQQARLHQAAVLQAELAELALKADLDGFQRHLVQGAGRLLESDAVLLVLGMKKARAGSFINPWIAMQNGHFTSSLTRKRVLSANVCGPAILFVWKAHRRRSISTQPVPAKACCRRAHCFARPSEPAAAPLARWWL